MNKHTALKSTIEENQLFIHSSSQPLTKCKINEGVLGNTNANQLEIIRFETYG